MYIHTDTHGVFWVCVWKKTGRVLCIHLNIQFYKNSLTVGVSSLILFPSLRSAATSNTSFQLLIMLHTDDIATSVTDTYYYNMWSNEPQWFNLTSVTYRVDTENKILFTRAALFYLTNSEINQHFFYLLFSLGPIIIGLEKKCRHKEYNDMKEHSISRIHSIRHPSPANTHQRLCAHNLITKHIITAKQPRYFRALPRSQKRVDSCFYYWKHANEDRGGVDRVVSVWQGFNFITVCCVASSSFLLMFHSSPCHPSFSASVHVAQWCTESTKKRVLAGVGQTDLPFNANYECDLVNSQERLCFHFKRVAVRTLNIASLQKSHSDICWKDLLITI